MLAMVAQHCVHARRAFTLFEVGLSLVLVTTGVISVMMLFPIGIKAEQLSRFQLYASAKAIELVETCNSFNNANAFAPETTNPWDVPSSYRSLNPDLEVRVSSVRSGCFPLPTSIARRLDSDGDEIQGLLDEGGYMYYAQPLATFNAKETALRGITTVANEARRLVFGINGYAQQNALPYLPQKGWPYYEPYPSPPSHMTSNDKTFLLEDPSVTDPDIINVFSYVNGDASDPKNTYGYLYYSGENAYSNYPSFNPPILGDGEAAKRYCQVAVWFAAKKSIPPAFLAGTATQTDVNNALATQTACAGYVNAMRFLAHAAICLTKHFDKSTLDAGVDIQPLTINTVASSQLTITHDKIMNYHESCLRLATGFAARYPYNWGAPRPLNRAIMTDIPLLQYDVDMAAPIQSGDINGAPGITAQQWKVIPAHAISNTGRRYYCDDGYVRGTPDIGANVWSTNDDHFNLTDRFAAAERCRQLIFWDVDWQSYEDFETAPSAQVDASKYPLAPPSIWNHPIGERMGYSYFRDTDQPSFRNPEKTILFRRDISGQPTGFDISKIICGNDDMTTEAGVMNENNAAIKDAGAGNNQDGDDARSVFSGLWGADRNGNRVLDRGPIPASVRLRAIPVARFNVYDPRVAMTLR